MDRMEVAKFMASKIGPDELQEILNGLKGIDGAEVIAEYMGLAFEWHLENDNFPSDWTDLDTGIYRIQWFGEDKQLHGIEWYRDSKEVKRF